VKITHPNTGPIPNELMWGYGYRAEWPEIEIPGRGAFRAPPAVAALPRDKRGYPVAYSFARQATKDGGLEASFTMIEGQRVLSCGEMNLCGICGKGLAKDEGFDWDSGPQRWYFIGGPQSCERTWTFNDPPMHFACAMFSMRVCPWMTLGRYRRHGEGLVHEAGINISLDDGDQRPVKIGLLSCPSADFLKEDLLWVARFPKLLGYVAPAGWPTDEQMRLYWEKSERAKMMPDLKRMYMTYTLFQHRMGLMLDQGHFLTTGRIRWIPNPAITFNPVTILGDATPEGADAVVAQTQNEE